MDVSSVLTNDVATVLVIGLAVAFLVEILKHTGVNEKLSTILVDLLTLVLGLVGGLIAMYVTGGTFAQYVGLGLTGGLASPYIYDVINKVTGGKYTKKVGETQQDELTMKVGE